MNLFRLNLFQKIFVCILVVELIAGCIATSLSYQLVKRDFSNRDMNYLLVHTVDHARELERVFSYGRITVHTLSVHAGIRDFMTGKRTGLSSPNEVLSALEYHNIEKVFSAIYLVNPEGVTVLSTDPSFVDHNFGFRKYFKDAIRGSFGADVGVGIVSRRMGYYFSYPIYNVGGSKIIGVVVAKMDPLVIDDAVSQADFNIDVTRMLADDNGVIVYSDKPDRVFSSLGAMTEGEINEEAETRFLGRDIQALTYDPIQSEVTNYINPRVLEFYDERDRMDEVVTIAKVGEYPFFYVIEASSEDLVEYITKHVYPIMIFVSATLGLALIAIGIILYLFLKPISQIRDYTSKVSKRERVVRMDIKSGDELEEIAESVTKIVNR